MRRVEELQARDLSRARPYDGAWHQHDHAQVFAVLEGLAVVRTPEVNLVVPPGRLCWIPPACPHCARTYGPIRVASLYLSPAAGPHFPRPRAVMGSRLALAVLERLTQRGSSHGGVRQRLCEVLVDEIAAGPSHDLQLPMPTSAALQWLARCVLENPAELRTLDEWATRLGMSRRTLTRQFRAECGLSFAQWRQQARLLRALQGMAEGQSVTEAAVSVGYDSLSAFIAVFRKYLGVTPGEYRFR